MTYSGQRVQVAVTVVPRCCIIDPELRLFQYTAIDEFTRLCFLWAYEEQSTYHLRQSFLLGEVTPELANRISCKLARHFTRGNCD